MPIDENATIVVTAFGTVPRFAHGKVRGEARPAFQRAFADQLCGFKQTV